MHNGVKHAVLMYPGTRGLPKGQVEALRALYRVLLDRALKVEVWPSGWVSRVEWASGADADQAEWVRGQMFVVEVGDRVGGRDR